MGKSSSKGWNESLFGGTNGGNEANVIEIDGENFIIAPNDAIYSSELWETKPPLCVNCGENVHTFKEFIELGLRFVESEEYICDVCEMIPEVQTVYPRR